MGFAGNNSATSVNSTLCQEIFPNVKFRYQSQITNVQKKSIFYCGIPKVATTFTKGLLGNLPKCKRNNNCEIKVPSFNSEKHPIASDTFSFMWIRDPYSRLFAAYENKLYHPNLFWYSVGKDVVNTVRRNTQTWTWGKDWGQASFGYDVSFSEFIKYILVSAATIPLSSIDVHFKPMHLMCNPCETRFDFIGRFEHFLDSVDHVCNTFNEIGLLEGTEGIRHCDSNRRGLDNRVHKLYEVLRQQSWSTQQQREIMKRTWSSYQVRGLVSTAISIPFTDARLTKITEDEYMNAIIDAIETSTNKTKLDAQRHGAMTQAYMTVPMADMIKLKEYVKTDSLLFGYDIEPADLFRDRKLVMPTPTFDYFGGLQNMNYDRAE